MSLLSSTNRVALQRYFALDEWMSSFVGCPVWCKGTPSSILASRMSSLVPITCHFLSITLKLLRLAILNGLVAVYNRSDHKNPPTALLNDFQSLRTSHQVEQYPPEWVFQFWETWKVSYSTIISISAMWVGWKGTVSRIFSFSTFKSIFLYPSQIYKRMWCLVPRWIRQRYQQ